ncbi:hypothetical protein PI124_g11539 [Phytophthora idaei]|nr:hypothetical protein PI125_g17016 [Phytophthora idaei]KAG3152536.1 hypothetical protein PI126_g10466 [Phytophthora idaei]KAG3243642.1 hypothetical protein PI124_g11539 [Phytophthora idaei]
MLMQMMAVQQKAMQQQQQQLQAFLEHQTRAQNELFENRLEPAGREARLGCRSSMARLRRI